MTSIWVFNERWNLFFVGHNLHGATKIAPCACAIKDSLCRSKYKYTVKTNIKISWCCHLHKHSLPPQHHSIHLSASNLWSYNITNKACSFAFGTKMSFVPDKTGYHRLRASTHLLYILKDLDNSCVQLCIMNIKDTEARTKSYLLSFLNL